MMMTQLRPSPRGNRITDRDIAILESLSIARLLTMEGLEWLHVSNWEERWKRHRATGHPHYRPSTYLYERVHFLLREHWVARFRRSVQMASQHFGREMDAYYLTESGARLLAEARSQPLETIDYTRSRPRSYFTISHGVEIGSVYAALTARMRQIPGLSLEQWQGDHITAKSYDRIVVRRRTSAGQPEQVKLPVQPDATFVWRHPNGSERIFLELDRGTRALTTWIEKIQAYAAYMGSDELKARYGVESFMVLTVAPHDRQRHALMQATAGALGKPHGRYLFTLKESVHPTTIGQGWIKLSTITPSHNPRRPTITTEPHPLLR